LHEATSKCGLPRKFKEARTFGDNLAWTTNVTNFVHLYDLAIDGGCEETNRENQLTEIHDSARIVWLLFAMSVAFRFQAPIK
jgi:hypothetical protein